jgi:hypothetical protein
VAANGHPVQERTDHNISDLLQHQCDDADREEEHQSSSQLPTSGSPGSHHNHRNDPHWRLDQHRDRTPDPRLDEQNPHGTNGETRPEDDRK